MLVLFGDGKTNLISKYAGFQTNPESSAMHCDMQGHIR